MVAVSNMNIPVFEENKPTAKVEMSDLTTSKGVFCRDPFIMPYDGKYYLYRTEGEGGIACLVSDDLEHWSKPCVVFAVPENFHGVKQLFWAPECHYYKGNFYIFTSVYSSKYKHRVISVYRANNPLGPFEDIADGCISPKNWDAIDGTLYIDKEGEPWMIFVHEWTCMPNNNGGMVAARLSDDFTHLISEPIQLFLAQDPSWSTHGVTDGPFLFRLSDGKLGMIWSNFSNGSYCIGIAFSDNGEITGNWYHQDDVLYRRGLKPDFVYDGGHGMLFYDNDGKLRLSLHSPNYEENVFERVKLLYVEEKDGTLVL